MEEKRLFLLDAYALIYRAYYALIRAPRVTSYGLNTSAIFGFCNTLNEVLSKENPTHIAVCFDPPGGKTFRHELYEEYKAGRDKQPEDITAAIPYIKEILDAYNIPVVEVEGYEADDVIGTLSRMAERDGFITYMMTPDKDYGQLVTDRVFQYRPPLRGEGFQIRGPKEIEERFGIDTPRQVIDILALEGDKSDNIPGCPGIGEKTASALIKEWGSVENLIEHTFDLKGATQRKIADNAEQILFSKMLATIDTEVPLGGITPDSLMRKPMDVNKLIAVYGKLEFRTFINRLNASHMAEQAPAPAEKAAEGMMGSLFDMAPDAATAPLSSIKSAEADYRDVDAENIAEIKSIVDEAIIAGEAGIALYCAGDTPVTMRPLGIAISVKPRQARYISLDNGDGDTMLQSLKPMLESESVTLVCHDVKTAIVAFRSVGVKIDAPYFDTSVAHYLLEPEMNHTLTQVAARSLNYRMEAEEIKPGQRLAPMPQRKAAERFCEIADITLQLKAPLTGEIAQQGMTPLLNDIELPLIKVLAAMEITGVRIDPLELHELSKRFTARMRELEAKAFEIAGQEFNVSSPMQVGEILFEKLKIDPNAKKTKKGSYSTTEEILAKYRAEHPIAGLILDIRALKKLLATYVNALPELINPKTGKIHTTYNQTVTATGRISSTNPNLQNIPIRTEDGREIRRAFIPDPGDILVSADYSQIELRLIADISGDEGMIEAFREGHDIHRATAAKIYHLPIDETPDDLRRKAKTANFGIIYGISAFGLSERLGIPRAEAKELIDGYFRSYPAIREYMDNAINTARDQGFVTTIMGRKRMLPDINSRNAVVRGYAERNAINAPIQGSAADIIKRAMIDIYREMRLRGMRSRMIMQVHDELVFNVVPDELAELQELIADKMRGAYNGRVSLEVSSGAGRNWLEAH